MGGERFAFSRECPYLKSRYGHPAFVNEQLDKINAFGLHKPYRSATHHLMGCEHQALQAGTVRTTLPII